MNAPYRVAFREEALAELRDLAAWVGRASGYPDRGRAFARRLSDVCEGLGDAPLRGARRSEWGADDRTIGFARRATIVFRVIGAERTVLIVAIAYGGRDLDALIGGRR